MSIIIHHPFISSPAFDDFLNNLIESELCYRASALEIFTDDQNEMNSAVERAIRACHTRQLPIDHHFRVLFVSDGNRVVRDWRVSALARKLIILNGSTSNPIVAKMQLEILEHLDPMA